MDKITIFYDGACPLCVSEMTRLKECDSRGFVDLIDLNLSDFSERHPDIDKQKAQQVLHGKLSDGTLLLGLDVTCHAWRSVGKHRWLSLLRLPLIRQLSDLGYKLFARNRYTISYVFTGKSRCQSCEIGDRMKSEQAKLNNGRDLEASR